MTDQSDYPPLRPCPRCGVVPERGMELDRAFSLNHLRFRFTCSPDCGEFRVTTSTRAEAADKWNRRAKL